MDRESFKSRLGFLLVSAGCAIGIGNVRRFPYVTGQNGGLFLSRSRMCLSTWQADVSGEPCFSCL